MVKLINKDHNHWDEKLDSILFGYRVAKQRSTGFSPFFMLYHRETRLPVDISISPICHNSDDNTTSVDNFVNDMMQVRDDPKPQAVLNIQSAHENQKMYYDKKNMCHR